MNCLHAPLATAYNITLTPFALHHIMHNSHYFLTLILSPFLCCLVKFLIFHLRVADLKSKCFFFLNVPEKLYTPLV